jgi:hypothetical protein
MADGDLPPGDYTYNDYLQTRQAPITPVPQTPGSTFGTNVPITPSLAPIYGRESGFNFSAQNPKSTASGAGQDINATWREAMHALGYGDQWTHAKDAPEGVQNAANIWLQGRYGNKPWAASEPGARPPAASATTASGHWNIAPEAVASEQAAGNDVVWMTPADYLAMSPEQGETNGKQMQSLMRSLDSGDQVQTIPSFDVKQTKDGNLAIEDQDGRNRALAAQKAGVDLIPVAIKGVSSKTTKPKSITDLRGKTHPFDFEHFMEQFNPITSAQAATREQTAQQAWRDIPEAQWKAEQTAAPAGATDETEAQYQAGVNRQLFAGGVREAIGAGAEFLSRILPQGVTDTINSINNRLADLGAPLARVPAGGIPQMEQQRQASMAALRAQPHAFGVEETGEMLPVAPLGTGAGWLAGKLGAGLAARAGAYGLVGAAGGMMAPTSANYWPEKTGQMVSGGLLGAVAAPVVDMAQPLLRWAGRLVSGAPTKAAEAVISRIGPGAPTAQDMMDIAAASPKPLTLADMSKRLANLAGRVARTPGEAADIVVQNLGARASARGARIYSDVAQNVGSANLYEATTALSQARAAEARPLYETALQPGSTAPIADMLRSHAADAQAEYNAAAREVANLSNRVDAQGRPIYRVPAGQARATTESAVAEKLQRPGDLDAATARAHTAAQRLTEIKEAADAAAEAQKAGIRGAVWSPRLGRLMANPEMRSGISTGLRTLRNEADARGEPFNPRDYAITGQDTNGEPIVSKVPNMRLLQAAKIGLESKVEAFRNPVTGRLDLTQLGRSQAELLAALREELHTLNPTYAKADAIWSGISKQRDAALWGSKILTMDKNAIRDRMARMTPDEQEFARLGMGSMLHDYLEKTNASPARIGSLLSDLYKGRLEPMFRTPADFDRFVDALQKERQMAATDTRVLQNSLTAERLAEDRGPAVHPAGVHHMIGAGFGLSHGNPFMLGYHGAQLAASALRNRGAGLTPTINAEIARTLTTPLSGPNSPGMAMLRDAAKMLPQVRRLYGNYVAGTAGQMLGNEQ